MATRAASKQVFSMSEKLSHFYVSTFQELLWTLKWTTEQIATCDDTRCMSF